jgi:hypothetical protein
VEGAAFGGLTGPDFREVETRLPAEVLRDFCSWEGTEEVWLGLVKGLNFLGVVVGRKAGICGRGAGGEGEKGKERE